MAIPFAAWLFQGIPECIAVAAFVFSLGSDRLQWRTITLVGICQAITIYLVRLLPLSSYLHVIIAIVTSAYFCARIGQLDLQLSYIYTLLAVFVVMNLEFVFMYLFNYLKLITYEQFLTDVRLRIVLGLPQVIGVLLLALSISRRKRNGRIKIFRIDFKLPEGKRDASKRNMASYGELL